LSKRNFIIYYPDSMRAESLSIYGRGNLKSPNYERMAENGVVFDNAFVQNPVCSPSRISMMTGRYVHNDGHRTLFHLLRNHEKSLLVYLKEHGYQIGWFGKNDLYARDMVQFLVGPVDKENNFPEKDNHRFSYGEDGYYSFLENPSYSGLPERSESQVERAVEFIRNMTEEGKPFCAFIPVGMPHGPYYAPEPYHHMYDGVDLPPIKPYPDAPIPSYHNHIRNYRHLDKMDRNDFIEMQKVYSGMVAFSDRLLGRILDVMEELGLDDTTTLFATSDHGEFAGDYGLPEKWPNAMTDNLIHVPLLVKSPEAEKGLRVHGAVESFDLMATVMEMAGIEAEHSHFATSLLPHIQGKYENTERFVFCEGGYDVHEPHAFEGYEPRGGSIRNPESLYYPKALQQQKEPASVCRTTMIRNLEFKLVRRTSDLNELYNLREDPMEIHNLYYDEEYRETVLYLESRMLEWLIRTSDTVPFDEDSRGFVYEES